MKINELYHSQFVLVHPDGKYDLPILTELIADAIEENLKDSSQIRYVAEERVKNEDIRNPEYLPKPKTASLGYLKTIYETITHNEFDYEAYKKSTELNEPDRVFTAVIGSFDKIISTKKAKK